MRIAIYVRVSTQRQAQTQTIEQQLERLRAHLQSQCWELLDENIFRDDGYSGAGLNRPGLDRLRDKVKAAEVDRVLITAPDRLARNYVHQMVLLEELAGYGCEVEFLDRPMSHDPHDQLLLQIRGAVAEYERTLIAERMRRGRQMKLRAGKLLPWTHVLYGYRVNPEQPRDPAGVSRDDANAAVVRELFASYLEDGATLFSLAQHLHTAGIPSPTGKAYWRTATIRGLLRNPAYTGQVYAGRTRPQLPQTRRSALQPVARRGQSQRAVPETEWLPTVTIPALVTQEQFDLVQAKLAHNQQTASRHNTAHTYLLRALVNCGVCQAACFCRTCSPDYGYYICRHKTDRLGRPQGCPARYAPAQVLDELVWQDLCEVLTHPESIAQALERAQGGHWLPQELHARRENLRKGQGSLAHQLDRLSDAYLQSIIPLAEYQRRRQELEQRSQALATQEKLLEAQAFRYVEVAGLVTAVKDFCQRVRAGLANATFEQRRQLVELLIDRVIITNDEVEIRYVIPTSPRSEHVRFCHLRKDYFDMHPFAIPVAGALDAGHITHQIERFFIPSAPPSDDGHWAIRGFREVHLLAEDAVPARHRQVRQAQPFIVYPNLNILGGATGILPSIPSHFRLQFWAIEFTIAQEDHRRGFWHPRFDFADQSQMRLGREMAFLAFDHQPADRDGAVGIHDTHHQRQAAARHRTAIHDQHQRPHGRQPLQQRLHKRQKIQFKCDGRVLNPAAHLFRAAVGVNIARHLTRHFRQLTTLARDNPADHKDQRFQVAGQITLRFFGIQLLHRLFYGTILAMAVTHDGAPVL